MKLKELQVTYKIDEEQHIKLLKLLEVVRKYENKEEKGTYPFKDITLKELFENLMFLGSKHTIDNAIDEYAWHFNK